MSANGQWHEEAQSTSHQLMTRLGKPAIPRKYTSAPIKPLPVLTMRR